MAEKAQRNAMAPQPGKPAKGATAKIAGKTTTAKAPPGKAVGKKARKAC